MLCYWGCGPLWNEGLRNDRFYVSTFALGLDSCCFCCCCCGCLWLHMSWSPGLECANEWNACTPRTIANPFNYDCFVHYKMHTHTIYCAESYDECVRSDVCLRAMWAQARVKSWNSTKFHTHTKRATQQANQTYVYTRIHSASWYYTQTHTHTPQLCVIGQYQRKRRSVSDWVCARVCARRPAEGVRSVECDIYIRVFVFCVLWMCEVCQTRSHAPDHTNDRMLHHNNINTIMTYMIQTHTQNTQERMLLVLQPVSGVEPYIHWVA